MNPRPRKLRLLRWLPASLFLIDGPSAGRKLYLSFDDGPDPEYTPKVLDLLAANDARASFFLVGGRAEQYPDLVRRMVSEGHMIGNHSFSHPAFEQLSLSAQLEEVAHTDRVLATFDGQAQHAFRPPCGVLPLPLVLNFAWRRRNIAYWSFDSLDYQRRPTAELAELLRQQPPRAGDVVLMHDDSAHTMELLEILLPEWRAQGFAMEALPGRAA
ncbi:MAG: polysaccharide deacetylase family protein [Dokdonella sp.]